MPIDPLYEYCLHKAPCTQDLPIEINLTSTVTRSIYMYKEVLIIILVVFSKW